MVSEHRKVYQASLQYKFVPIQGKQLSTGALIEKMINPYEGTAAQENGLAIQMTLF